MSSCHSIHFLYIIYNIYISMVSSVKADNSNLCNVLARQKNDQNCLFNRLLMIGFV